MRWEATHLRIDPQLNKGYHCPPMGNLDLRSKGPLQALVAFKISIFIIWRKSWNHHDSIPVDPQAPVLQEPPHSPRQENSPIRTLSEDRRHVSLRLGLQHVPNQMDSSMQARLSERPGIITRSVAKKKDGKMPQKKKYNTSPLKGVSIKKRRVFKTQNSPRRRTQTGNTAAPSQRQGTRKTTIIPSITKKQKDFRVNPSALP